MKFLLLIVYIAIGFVLNKTVPQSGRLLPKLLVRYIVPLVIFLTCVKYSSSLINVTLLMFFLSLTMFLCALLIYRGHQHRKVLRLCLSQYNIGLIGLPVGIHLFGDGAVPIILSAFLGGMLFGNSIGIFSLINSSQLRKSYLIKQMLSSPPLFSLVVALVFITLKVPVDFNGPIGDIYGWSKTALSTLGMVVMGLSLSQYPVYWKKWRQYVSFSLSKILLSCFVALMIFGGAYAQGWIDQQTLKYMALLPFLPSAANIITLEAHYKGTGHSASMICANTMIASCWLFCLSLFFVH